MAITFHHKVLSNKKG